MRHGKIKASLELAIGTDGDDVLIGSNRDDQSGDVLDGGAGNDTFMTFQGADTIIGGSGADTWHFQSWADSNANHPYDLGVDYWGDFSVADGDKISFTAVKHYYDSNGDGEVDATRALTMDDITFTDVGDDVQMDVSVWEGDNTWDITALLGETPTEANIIFAA